MSSPAFGMGRTWKYNSFSNWETEYELECPPLQFSRLSAANVLILFIITSIDVSPCQFYPNRPTALQSWYKKKRCSLYIAKIHSYPKAMCSHCSTEIVDEYFDYGGNQGFMAMTDQRKWVSSRGERGGKKWPPPRARQNFLRLPLAKIVLRQQSIWNSGKSRKWIYYCIKRGCRCPSLRLW